MLFNKINEAGRHIQAALARESMQDRNRYAIAETVSRSGRQRGLNAFFGGDLLL
jgi:hypothetical protein